MYTAKIQDIDALAALVAEQRRRGKRVVLCHGTFDLLHVGHIRYFREAKAMGDLLVVTVTPDRFVDKGPGRPAFTETLRVEAVASLDCVDYAAVNQWPTAVETLSRLRPDVYVKGGEFREVHDDPSGKMALEVATADSLGVEVRFTNGLVFSSSNLINRFLSSFPEDIRQYLQLFKQRFRFEDCVAALEGMSALNVLVVGDAILDEYQYCRMLGASSKDPTLAMLFESSDTFAGGAVAVANHLAGFAAQVTLVTVLGERDSREAFVRQSLRDNVTPLFHYLPGAPTTIKRRILDGYSTNKLIEVYVMDDRGLPEERDAAMTRQLGELARAHDLVVVADFGHGAISAGAIAALRQGARYLAVNTQANAGNRGFNTILKYPRPDYGCLAEHELRLTERDSKRNFRVLAESLRARTEARHLMVTRGRAGAEISAASGRYIQVPSFAQKVVDRIGAGDALFAVTSLAMSQGVDEELVGFIGNVAGGLAVEIIGNAKYIDKMMLQKYMHSLMK